MDARWKRCHCHRIQEEANGATGTAIREYIWLDDLPVAMVDNTGASPVLYFIHTDQIGTPQKITDASASVVWEGLFDPFGNMITVTGANWGTGIWGSFGWALSSPTITSTNLRFPGQYADAETALNQNWNRDYDPSTGRYIQSDPLGLMNGPNLYAYADSNPISMFDSRGLVPSDKTFGLPKKFWKWYHRNVKRPGNPDLTKEEAEEYYKEWCASGKPGPDSKRAKDNSPELPEDGKQNEFAPIPQFDWSKPPPWLPLLLFAPILIGIPA